MSLQRNMVLTIGKNLSIYRDFLNAPSLVNISPETAGNGWQVFAHRPKFSHWQTLPALPHGRYITDFDTCYVVAQANGLEQQNAGRAHAGLCRASSLHYI